jgi:Predicted ferric reductase
MKKFLGIGTICFTVLITCITWFLVVPSGQFLVPRQFAQLFASLAILLFSWLFFISTRNPIIDTLFHGLDKAYVYHKYIAISAIVLIWIHKLSINLRDFPGVSSVGRDAFERRKNFSIVPGTLLANWSLYIFTGLVVLFLILVKLDYQTWKLMHKVILIPYVLGIVHYYENSNYNTLGFSPYAIWMDVIIIIGIISGIYSIFLYERISFKYQYHIVSAKEVANGMIELTGQAIGKAMDYKSGQFAFIKIKGKEKAFPSHPFSISVAPDNKQIQFSIKGLGDHTKKLQELVKEGDTLLVAGPNGKYDYRSGGRHQIWVAGGIGITPFRAFLQSEIPTDYEIDFFYAFNNIKEGAYAEELMQLKPRNNIRLHLIDSSKVGFLQQKTFEDTLNKDNSYDLFFCGPFGMRKKVVSDLEAAAFRIKEIHFEVFKFK